MTNDERDEILHKMDKTLTYIKTTVNHIEKEYVSKHSFMPVRLIAYGLAGSIFVAFIGAVVSQTIKS